MISVIIDTAWDALTVTRETEEFSITNREDYSERRIYEVKLVQNDLLYC